MEKTTQSLISKLLRTAGISSRNGGYSYLKRSVELCVDDKEVLRQMVKRLYPKVGAAKNVSAVLVERTIRNAITNAWDKGKLKNLEKEIGEENLFNECPTPGEFIGVIVKKVCPNTDDE